MSTALVTALRDSCGYLRDGGYHETARMVGMAADEIERLRARVQALEDGTAAQVPTRDRLRAAAPAAELPPARRGVQANR